MGEVTDIGIARLRQATDNKDISVRELLLLTLDSLDRGEIEGKPIRALVLIESDLGDGNVIESYRSGCSRYEEIALIALHQARQIELWRKP